MVGKEQPMDKGLVMSQNGDYFYNEASRFYGFDKSFKSKNYCCAPGGGYFLNDRSIDRYDKYAFYTGFRDYKLGNDVLVSKELVEDFLNNPKNFHLLDGFTVDGNPKSKHRPTAYMAYWTAIKNGYGSGLNDQRKRRRRALSGKLLRRDTGQGFEKMGKIKILEK